MKRAALLAAIIAVCAVAGVLLARPKKTDEQKLGEAQMSATLTLFPSALCRFTAALDRKDRVVSRNEYWDSVHQTSHLIAAMLGKKDKVQQESLMEAHGALERDLATLAPALFDHGETYVKEIRNAMRTLDLSGADRACS